MNTSEITKKISLEPVYIDHNIKTNIFERIKETTKDDCYEDHGYILGIEKVNTITPIYDNVFEVKFDANVLKFEIGDKTYAKVCMVFPDGIFLIAFDKQRILVPYSYLTDYTFNTLQSSYIRTKDGKEIKEGDIVNVEITNVKYNRKQFNCIAKLNLDL